MGTLYGVPIVPSYTTYYASLLWQFSENIIVKRRGKLNKGVLLYEDNTPAHVCYRHGCHQWVSLSHLISFFHLFPSWTMPFLVSIFSQMMTSYMQSRTFSQKSNLCMWGSRFFNMSSYILDFVNRTYTVARLEIGDRALGRMVWGIVESVPFLRNCLVRTWGNQRTNGPKPLTWVLSVFWNGFEGHYRRLSHGPLTCLLEALCPSLVSWTQGSVPWVYLLIMLNSVLRSKVKQWPWPLILM